MSSSPFLCGGCLPARGWGKPNPWSVWLQRRPPPMPPFPLAHKMRQSVILMLPADPSSSVYDVVLEWPPGRGSFPRAIPACLLPFWPHEPIFLLSPRGSFLFPQGAWVGASFSRCCWGIGESRCARCVGGWVCPSGITLPEGTRGACPPEAGPWVETWGRGLARKKRPLRSRQK